MRFGLDVFLTDNLGGRAETFDAGMEIGDVEEARLLEPDIDERSLHPGQHARDFALVEITDQPLPLVALEVELAEDAVFEQPYPHFEGRGVDYDFAFHGVIFRTVPSWTSSTARLATYRGRRGVPTFKLYATESSAPGQ